MNEKIKKRVLQMRNEKWEMRNEKWEWEMIIRNEKWEMSYELTKKYFVKGLSN